MASPTRVSSASTRWPGTHLGAAACWRLGTDVGTQAGDRLAAGWVGAALEMPWSASALDSPFALDLSSKERLPGPLSSAETGGFAVLSEQRLC